MSAFFLFSMAPGKLVALIVTIAFATYFCSLFQKKYLNILRSANILETFVWKNKIQNSLSDFERGLHGHYGKWNYGLKHRELCGLRQNVKYGCCDMSKVQHLHFKFKDCALNNMNVSEVLCDKLTNKNVLLIGNSLEYQLFKVIYFMLGDKPFIISKDETRHLTYEFDHGCNGTVRFAFKLVMSKSLLKYFINKSDIVLFNCGLHYQDWNVAKFVKYVDWISKILKTGHKTVIVRNTLPQHFPTKYGFYNPNEAHQMKVSTCTFVAQLRSHPSNIFLRYMAKKYNFGYMDEYALFVPRWDLHVNKGDCTHYCDTSELFYPQITVLLQLLR